MDKGIDLSNVLKNNKNTLPGFVEMLLESQSYHSRCFTELTPELNTEKSKVVDDGEV